MPSEQPVEIPAHLQRVIEELRGLNRKIYALNDFIGGIVYQGLDKAEQDRLRAQLGAMNLYANILW